MDAIPTTRASAPPLTAPHAACASSLSFEQTDTAFAAKSDAELRKASLLFAALDQAWLTRLGIPLTMALLRLRVPGVEWLIKRTVFAHFCGGENIQECQPVVEALGRYGVQSILDYSAEGEETEAGFDATARETRATIEWAASHPHIPFSVFKPTGLARFALLEKLNAREPLTPEEQAEWERVRQRVEGICQRAFDLNVRLFIDAEETWIQDVIDALAEQMMARFNRERPIIHNTYQLYRTAALGNLRAALERAEAKGYFFGAKLVRGAYMEKERRRAKERGGVDPIQPSKVATDAAYDEAMLACLDELERVSVCAGTHNEASTRLLVEELARRGIAPEDPRVFFSQLYGMSDHLSFNLARAGHNVAKYLPYGPVRSVVPYLVRRAEENSAITGQGGREVRLIRSELHRRKHQSALAANTVAP